MVAWIGRGETIAWPPRSPDLTPLQFSVCGYINYKFFVPSLPVSWEKLLALITEAVETVEVDMIRSIWDEIAFRWNKYRVTRENHIEHP
jgi:hypothetical protein